MIVWNSRLKHCVFLVAALVPTFSTLQAKSLLNVEYAKAADQGLHMDADIPDGKGPFPAIILVHGGAWVTGDKQRNVQPLFRPLHDAGYAWFSINYRLATGDDAASLISVGTLQTLSAAVNDVRNAVAFIRAHADEYSIDPNRIVLIGESAGAHLISMAALRPSGNLALASSSGADNTELVRAAVAFYSPSDLKALVETSKNIPDSLRRAVKGTIIEKMLMAGLQDLSPQTWVRANAPPFLMIHGSADPLVPVEQSQSMCAALRNAGSKCDLFVVDGGGHGMNGWEVRGMTAYKPVLMKWLADVLQ